MKNLKGTMSEKNLMTAFVNESQARNKYTYFASVAKKEGYEQISAIFLETADNEKEHAEIFYKYLQNSCVEITWNFKAGLEKTLYNLQSALDGETEEWEILYPRFAQEALEEGFLDIANSFKYIAEVEKQHAKRYQKLIHNIEKFEVFSKRDEIIWKCRNCGYHHNGKESPDICPSCKHSKSYFEVYCENF